MSNGGAGWLWRPVSVAGGVCALLAVAAALTPGLIPRTWVTQGALSGCAAAAGYAAGAFLGWLWRFLELPDPARPGLRLARAVALAGGVILVGYAMWFARAWQDDVRQRMGMALAPRSDALEATLLAVVVFLLLLVLGRLFLLVLRSAARGFSRLVPPRVAALLGAICAVLLFWGVFNGVLLRFALHAADSSYAAVDALIPAESAPPDDPRVPGSAASLVRWEDLGAAGRRFVTGAPSPEALSRFAPGPVVRPLRVYVGQRAAETPRERAALALAEMKRVGAFDRKVLVIITPTGTGWVDPGGVDTLEFLHGGDVASVAAQYSYLASWLSLLVEPGYGADMARALFLEVYGYWTTLPKASRPKLYLHGLSLGAMNSERSAELFEIIGDPYQGAMFAGPPFPSRIWRTITDNRNPGSPEWLPRFRDGAHVRFTAQRNALEEQGAHWGPMRTVYLQYASDPVTFFSFSSFYREPDWMKPPRGPDVSPLLRWTPGVTFLQLALDMAMATTTPAGYGHVYAAGDYLDAWLAVSAPEGWTPERIARLKQYFTSSGE